MSESRFSESNAMAESAHQSDPDATLPGPGSQLSAHRQALGWTVEQIADQLKLAPRQVLALEADDFAALPGSAVTRGFIRAYAKVLKMDAAALIAMLPADTVAASQPMPVRRELSTPFAQTRMPFSDRRSNWTKWTVGAAILGALLLAVIVGQHMGWLPVLPKSLSFNPDKELASDAVVGAATAPVAPPVLLTNPGASGATGTQTDAPSGGAPDAVSRTAVPAAMAPLKAAQTVTATSSAVPPAAAILPTGVPAAAPNAENRLVLTLHEDSWVEIKTAGGIKLLSRLLKAGTTENVEIKEPVTLAIGNVRGVDASLRGAPLLLSSATGNTTRLDLK